MGEIENFKDSTIFIEVILPQGDFKFINNCWETWALELGSFVVFENILGKKEIQDTKSLKIIFFF